MIAFLAEPCVVFDVREHVVSALVIDPESAQAHADAQMRCSLCVFGSEKAGLRYDSAERAAVADAFLAFCGRSADMCVVYAGREPGEPARVVLSLFDMLAGAASRWSGEAHGAVLVVEHASQRTPEGAVPVHCHVLSSPAGAGFADMAERVAAKEWPGVVSDVVRG